MLEHSAFRLQDSIKCRILATLYVACITEDNDAWKRCFIGEPWHTGSTR